MDSALIALLANGGVAGVVVVLMILGWLVPKWVYSSLEKENKHLREALELERQRNKEAVSSMGVTNQLIGALVNLAEKNQPAQLTGKDP